MLLSQQSLVIKPVHTRVERVQLTRFNRSAACRQRRLCSSICQKVFINQTLHSTITPLCTRPSQFSTNTLAAKRTIHFYSRTPLKSNLESLTISQSGPWGSPGGRCSPGSTASCAPSSEPESRSWLWAWAGRIQARDSAPAHEPQAPRSSSAPSERKSQPSSQIAQPASLPYGHRCHNLSGCVREWETGRLRGCVRRGRELWRAYLLTKVGCLLQIFTPLTALV